MNLKESLERKLGSLREMNDQPERYLNQFFVSLRKEIVSQSEVMLCDHLSDRPVFTNRPPASESERICDVRRFFYNGFKKIEKEFVERIKLGKFEWASYHARLAELTKLVESYQADLGVDLDNVFLPKVRDRAKYEHDSISDQLDAEIERVKCELFNSKTIFFEPSLRNGFGFLIVFDGPRLSQHEVSYLRSRLKSIEPSKSKPKSSHLERRDLRPLFKFLNESINRSRQIELEPRCELTSISLVLDKFSDYVTKCTGYLLREKKEPLYHVYIDSSILVQDEVIGKPVSEIYFDWDRLDLSGNLISSIQASAFAHFRHLKRLDLSSNNLTALRANTFDELVHLNELILASNRLAAVDRNVFVKLKSLRKLDLSHNLLDENMLTESIPVLHLKKLDLSHNRISALNFRNLVIPSQITRCRLRRLALSHNFIENMSKDSFAKLAYLKHLDLSHNRIGIIVPKTFKLLSKIEQLDLSSNGIAEICKHNFKHLGSLKRLVLSNNLIGRVEAGSFKRLVSLDSLSLDSNEIDLIGCEHLFESNQMLRQLNLAHNNITGLSSKSGLAKLEGLKLLKLNHNPLTFIGPDSFKNLKNLRVLHLNDCQLTNLDTTAFHSLAKLDQVFLNKNPLNIVALRGIELPDRQFKIIYDSSQKDGDTSELSNPKTGSLCSLGLFF